MFENSADYFLLGSGITTILFVLFLIYKKEGIRKKNEYIKFLELENFEIKTENQSQKYKISELQTLQKSNEEKIFEKLEKLEYSRLALESEKNRLIRLEDDERQKKEEQKYKAWVEHETNVISEIKQIAKSSECNLSVFDNQNLPIDFDFQLKPDCMIEFLDQYIIFDAKKSKNPKTYIAQQIKQTAEKISMVTSKEIFNKIYSTIFFVMPEAELKQLDQTIFQESGYTFIIISQTALPSIFYFLKKISQYENLKDFNPQERENLIHLIASYDTHISYQNAVNFVLAKQSFEINAIQNNLPEDFALGVKSLQQKTKNKTLNQLEIMKYAKNKNIQKKEILEVVQPNPAIDKEIIKQSEKLFESKYNNSNNNNNRNIKIEHV